GSWMPGTTLVIGVRFGGFGEITPRSVRGVNAKAGSPARELSGGVVSGLFVVRSVLSKQTASAILAPRRASKSSQRVLASPGPASARRSEIRMGGMSRTRAFADMIALHD